jgi:hypothetical protein
MRAMAAQIDKAVGGAFEGDAHAYLMAIYKDPLQETAVRIDAARAAQKPRLSPVEPQSAHDDHVPLVERLKAYARRRRSRAAGAMWSN